MEVLLVWQPTIEGHTTCATLLFFMFTLLFVLFVADFHYRPRVLQHWVHGAKTCREAYAGSTINEHSAEIEAELMQQDKDVLNAAHAAGHHPYNWCGPMREP